MAGSIRGITIKLAGDTSDLIKSLRAVDSATKSTQKQLKDVEKLLKLDPKNTELLRQKQQLLATQVENTKKKLVELNKAQAEMTAQGVDKNSEQYMALQREIAETTQNLEHLEQETQEFGSVGAQQIKAVGESMQDLGGKIEGAGQKLKGISTAAAGLEAALVGVGMKAITTSDDLNTMAKQTGLSTAEIQKIQYASDRMDVSLNTVTGALAKMKKNMTGQPEVWAQLGIRVRDASGHMRDTKDVFGEVIVKLSKIRNETERDQIAMQLFGRSADELAGIIDDGGAALRQYGQEAEDLGLILSQDVLDSLNATNDELDKAKAQLNAALLQLGATVAKVLTPIIQKISAFVEKVVAWMQKLTPGQMQLVMTILAIVAVLGPLLIIIGKVITSIGTILTFVPMIVSAISTIGTAVSGLFTFLAANPMVLVIAAIVVAVIALTVLIVKNIDKIKAALKAMADWVSGVFHGIANGIANFFNAVANTVRNIVNAIAGWLRSLLNLGASVASSFGGTQFHMSGMATGGTITAGTAIVGENGPELLTMLGNKAQITPLTSSQSQRALSSVGGNGGGSKTVVEVNFTGSLSQLARVLQPEIKVETQRVGPSLVRS